jgi:hypothetical protein
VVTDYMEINQCHIGTDTISLAQLGASMTGLDFSGKAVEAAQKVAADTRADATFVQSDGYLAAEVLGAGEADLVYTGTRSQSGGITGSARSSHRCSTLACGSWSSPSTTASRGPRCPARWSTSVTGNTG